MPYYYDHMRKDQQAVYFAMLQGFRNLDTEILMPRLAAEDLYNVFFLLRLDHPEIFWAVNFRYRYYNASDNLILVPEYLFPKNKIAEHQRAMTSRIDKLVRPAKELSEWEKERYIHDFICENVTYDKLKKPYSHEIIGPLGHGVGVCEGIAKTVKVLCDALGIWCMIAICGNNPEKGIKYRHTWNIVKIGGTYYHLDATFDNTLSLKTAPDGTSSQAAASAGNEGQKAFASKNPSKANSPKAKKNSRGRNPDTGIRYDYFNLDDKAIFRDHEPLIAPAPSCTNHEHFFYKEMKLSFTKEEEVAKRCLQAAKKGTSLTFHWRGGYLTREVLNNLLEKIAEAGKERQRYPMIGLNWPQAVLRVSYSEKIPEEELVVEDANEGEKYLEPAEG